MSWSCALDVNWQTNALVVGISSLLKPPEASQRHSRQAPVSIQSLTIWGVPAASTQRVQNNTMSSGIQLGYDIEITAKDNFMRAKELAGLAMRLQ